MFSGDNGGGNGAQDHTKWLDTVVLTYDRAADHLEVGGKFNSIDLAIDMLARATRALEAQLRAQHAIALQAQMQRAAEDEAIRRSLQGGR